MEFETGRIPFDQAFVRQVAVLVNQLPVINSDQFQEEYMSVSIKRSNWREGKSLKWVSYSCFPFVCAISGIQWLSSRHPVSHNDQGLQVSACQRFFNPLITYFLEVTCVCLWCLFFRMCMRACVRYCSMVNELSDKFSVVYEKYGSRRRGRLLG